MHQGELHFASFFRKKQAIVKLVINGKKFKKLQCYF